jgi:hypothetical protein
MPQVCYFHTKEEDTESYACVEFNGVLLVAFAKKRHTFRCSSAERLWKYAVADSLNVAYYYFYRQAQPKLGETNNSGQTLENRIQICIKQEVKY